MTVPFRRDVWIVRDFEQVLQNSDVQGGAWAPATAVKKARLTVGTRERDPVVALLPRVPAWEGERNKGTCRTVPNAPFITEY